MTSPPNTLNPPAWEGMTDARRATIHAGRYAVIVSRQGLERALAIGLVYVELQSEAMTRSNSNRPIGIRYNQALARLLEPVPELDHNNTARAQYVWCYENREKLLPWWEQLAPEDRERWNHPDAIKAHYLSDQAAVQNQTVAAQYRAEADAAFQAKLATVPFPRSLVVARAHQREAWEIADTILAEIPIDTPDVEQQLAALADELAEEGFEESIDVLRALRAIATDFPPGHRKIKPAREAMSAIMTRRDHDET